MTKYLTLLGHGMTRIFPILLFIGLALGQAEPVTSEIDYYQMGIDAAVQDYKDLKPTFGRITSDIWFRNPLKSQPMATNTLFEKGYKYQMSKYKGQEFVTFFGCALAITVAMPLIIGSLIPSPLI